MSTSLIMSLNPKQGMETLCNLSSRNMFEPGSSCSDQHQTFSFLGVLRTSLSRCLMHFHKIFTFIIMGNQIKTSCSVTGRKNCLVWFVLEEKNLRSWYLVWPAVILLHIFAESFLQCSAMCNVSYQTNLWTLWTNNLWQRYKVDRIFFFNWEYCFQLKNGKTFYPWQW